MGRHLSSDSVGSGGGSGRVRSTLRRPAHSSALDPLQLGSGTGTIVLNHTLDSGSVLAELAFERSAFTRDHAQVTGIIGDVGST